MRITPLAAAALLLLAAPRPTLADPPPDKAAKKAAKEAKEAKEAAKKAAKEAEKAEKAEKDKIHTTPSGLQYIDLVEGTGPTPARGQRVSVHYTGWLKNGQKFDSSVDRGKPIQFTLGTGQVIKGWDEGLATMKVGGKRKLIIPPEIGYGDRDVGPIPANSVLIFEVELLAVQ
jgi:peptidylprolyl isomerase